MKTITLTQLIALNVCETQINLFKEHCGESVIVSEKTAVSLSQVFHFYDVSKCFLSKDQFAKYKEELVPFWTINNESTYPAWKEYLVLHDLKHDDFSSSELANYQNAKKLAWSNYEKVLAKASIKLEKFKAILFVKFYNAA